MDEIEILENLLESVNKISYSNSEEFDVVEKRTEMIIRKFFGSQSHYLKDLENISYEPDFIIDGEADWQYYFNLGLKQFRNLIKIMIEDKKLSSNYNSSETIDSIKAEKITKSTDVKIKEIKVIIASPSDVIIERELLLDKLETKFRRDHFEERCGARIIVEGWEQVASQSGYPQDIINSDLLSQSNIVLAIFRHKLGSPTIDIKTGKDRSKSGTAEELL